MNNISLWEILYPQKLRTNRIYKIMKITLTLVFVSIFSMFAGNIHSQNARITFTKNNATLESVLNEIENQTDYLFIINSNIDTHQKVSVRAQMTLLYLKFWTNFFMILKYIILWKEVI